MVIIIIFKIGLQLLSETYLRNVNKLGKINTYFEGRINVISLLHRKFHRSDKKRIITHLQSKQD